MTTASIILGSLCVGFVAGVWCAWRLEQGATAYRVAENDALRADLARRTIERDEARYACGSWMERSDRFEQELHERRPAPRARKAAQC